MQQLIDIVKLVASKYMDKINLIISKNILTMEYLKLEHEEQDVYKTLEIIEFEKKLKVTVFPEKTVRITDITGLEDMILTLDKQSNAIKYSTEEVKFIKEKYPVGTKVELIKMYDLINPVPPKTKGIINNIDGIGTIHVNWGNGSTLGLVVGIDEFKILN